MCAVAQVATYGFWHATVYAGNASRALAAFKFSPENQYEPEGPVGHISSSSGALQVGDLGGSVCGGGGGASGISLVKVVQPDVRMPPCVTTAARTPHAGCLRRHSRPDATSADCAPASGHSRFPTPPTQREVLLTTFGWLQASLWQVVIIHAIATGGLPVPASPWAQPSVTVAWLLAGTYWRELHLCVDTMC